MNGQEKMRDDTVTYTLGIDGKFYIIENVPARVSEETGEQFFPPETVERLQSTIWGHKKPKKTCRITNLRIRRLSPHPERPHTSFEYIGQ